MLTHNTRNRQLSNSYVKSYANTMKRGEWKDNGEDIIFFSDGTLGNGAHRLNAIIQSGCSVRMGVKRGVEPDSFSSYDNGRNRTAGQLIQMQGIKNSNVAAAMAKFLHTFRSGRMTDIQLSGNNYISLSYNPGDKLTNSQIMDIFEENREQILSAINQTFYINEVKRFPLSRSFVAALYIHLQYDLGYAYEDVDKFFRELVSYKSSANTYIEALRVLYLKAGDGGYKMEARKIYNLLYSTWNDCMTHKPLRKRRKDGVEYYIPYWREDMGTIEILHRNKFNGQQLLLGIDVETEK